jgi:phytol kinase
MSAVLAAVGGNPWLGMGIEAAALATLMALLRVLQQQLSLAPEHSRKLFHAAGGLTTLAFPWLFHSQWPVLALAPLTVAALLALKYVRGLRRGLGAVLYGVERRSLGEVYLPLGVTLVWLLSGGHPLLYCVPVLILALADPAAALVGMRYGRTRYVSVGGEKSVEGSLAFVAVAFVAVLPPLLAGTAPEGSSAALIALNVALIAMVAEAVAWRGLDNLFIPIASYVALGALRGLPVPALVGQLAVTVGLGAFALLWQRRMARNRGAIVGATLGACLMLMVAGW